ncbi:MAG: hypothetical protein K2N74_02880 [Clostridiales bacterium]|nr:hypothetical protein [Clostridiales bacterium]
MKTLIGRKIIAFLAILALIVTSAALFVTAVHFSAENMTVSAEVVALADGDENAEENPAENEGENPDGNEGENPDENQDGSKEETPAVPMDTSIKSNAVGIVVLVLVVVCALFALVLALSDKNKDAKKAPKKK